MQPFLFLTLSDLNHDVYCPNQNMKLIKNFGACRVNLVNHDRSNVCSLTYSVKVYHYRLCMLYIVSIMCSEYVGHWCIGCNEVMG